MAILEAVHYFTTITIFTISPLIYDLQQIMSSCLPVNTSTDRLREL